MLGSYLRIPHFRELIGKYNYHKFDTTRTNFGILFEAYEMFSEANGCREKLEHENCNIYRPLCITTINFDKFDSAIRANLYGRFIDFTREIESTTEEQWSKMEIDGTPVQLKEWRYTLAVLKYEFDHFVNGIPSENKYFTLRGVANQGWGTIELQKIMVSPRLLYVDPEHVYEVEVKFGDAGGGFLRNVYYRYRLDFTGAIPKLRVDYDRQSLSDKQKNGDKKQSRGWTTHDLRELLNGRQLRDGDDYSFTGNWQPEGDILYIFHMYVTWGDGFGQKKNALAEAGEANDAPTRLNYGLQPRVGPGSACSANGACFDGVTCEAGVCKKLDIVEGGMCSDFELCLDWLTCEAGNCTVSPA